MDFLKEFVSFGTVITPIMILLVIVALVAVVRILARNYIKVAPNAVLTIYGRKYKGDRGFKLVTGGAAFCIPLLEKYEMMKLDAFKIDITVRNVPSEQGVPVDVSAVAVLKIGREDEMLEAAVSRFLGQTQQELQVIVQGQMEGALRGVVATMSVESLIKDRTTFGNRVQEQITGDLEKLGIRMDSLVIQEITDNQGYIEALGKKQTAMVKRDASIAEAEARRDEDILVAEALRQADEKSSEARKSGEIAKAKAEESISNAQRERDVIQAQNQAKVDAERAKIEVASAISRAQEDRNLRIAQVSAEEAETEARTKLQEKEKERKDAELEATIIVQAHREKEAMLIKADADKEASVKRAEGEKTAEQLRAEAARFRIEQEAEAAQLKAEREGQGQNLRMSAEAKGRMESAKAREAELKAEAEGFRAKGEAEAASRLALFKAEAEGILEKANAYTKLDENGRLLIILEHAPQIIRALGEGIKVAGEGTVVPMSQAIGTGIAGIEEIRLIDMGGGGNGKEGVVRQFVDTVPETIFSLIEKSRALGLENALRTALKSSGLDLDQFLKRKPQAEPTATQEPTASAEAE